MVMSEQQVSVRQSSSPEALVKKELPIAVPDDIKKVISQWNPILSEMGGLGKIYLKNAIPTLGPSADLQLVLDDENASGYLSENRANCIDKLKEIIRRRTGAEVPITIRKNDSGQRAKDVTPDLRNLVQFDIVEEDF